MARLLTCSRCRRVKYCTSACQKADWKDHKAECRKPRVSFSLLPVCVHTH